MTEDQDDASDPSEQAVIVRFDYGSINLAPLSALEDRLIAAIEAADVGEFDGNEIAVDGSHGFLYMYGPDANALFATVRPILESTEFMKAARVRLRYGPPGEGTNEVEIVLGR